LEYWDFPEDPELDGLSVSVMWYGPRGEPADPDAIQRIGEPLLSRWKATLTKVVPDNHHGVEAAYMRLRFPSLRSRTVEDAYEVGSDLIRLLDASETGSVSRTAALDLLRAARPDLLVGQVESEWLECKRAPYQVADERGKFELAKDVASFANADTGGVIIVGAEARKDADGVETVHTLRPFPSALASPQSYRSIIHRRVHPAVEGLEILRVRTAETGGSNTNLIVISVPPQVESFKPFLVRGAILGGKLNESYVTLVTRRNDQTHATDIASLHSLIAAGRAALAGSFGLSLRGGR
jgi:hypothetical protein